MKEKSSVAEFLKDYDIPKDSLEFMEKIMDIEDEFDIVISQNEYKSIKNKEELIALIEEKIK